MDGILRRTVVQTAQKGQLRQLRLLPIQRKLSPSGQKVELRRFDKKIGAPVFILFCWEFMQNFVSSQKYPFCFGKYMI